MLLVSDVYVLITYSSIVESFFIMLSVSAVLYFRYKRPTMDRPIKVSSAAFSWFFWQYAYINIFLWSGLVVDTRSVCHCVRLSGSRSGLCCAIWGRHGLANNVNWHPILLRRHRVEEQTNMGAARDWCVDRRRVCAVGAFGLDNRHVLTLKPTFTHSHINS